MNRRVGIKDVAAAAGVSPATVSNALNHPDRVRQERLAVIQSAIQRLGYIRSEPARHLRSGRSTTIGLLLLDAWNPGFMKMAEGVEDSVISTDWTVLIGNSRRDPVREQKYLRAYIEQQAAGLIVAPRDEIGDELDRIRASSTPVVILDRREVDPAQFSVSVDDYTGGYFAAKHLIDLGHREIVFVGTPDAAISVRERFSGVRHGVAEGPHAVRLTQVDAELTIAGGRTAGHTLARLEPRPTAAIAAIDMVAFGVLQSLTQERVVVPRDMSLCGYDDTDFAQQLSIPLTTVRRPHYELGQSAAHMLLDLLRGHEPDQHHLRFSPELVIRDSTAPPQEPNQAKT